MIEITDKLIGYKIFNNDLTNQYGLKFEINKTYTTIGDIVFGVKGNGFHFATNLEDSLRYGNLKEKNINSIISLVEGSGKIIQSNDEYYGYYDLCCASKLKILKILTREEIIEEAKNMLPQRLIRFIQGFALTKEEIEFFKNKNLKNRLIRDYIEYYQEGNTEMTR